MTEQRQFAEFTPGQPIWEDDLGLFQWVDGVRQNLNPARAQQVQEWREAGLSDEAIVGWLEIT